MNFKAKVRIFLPLLLVLAAILFVMPRGTKFPYEYKAGRQWQHEALYANFDFPLYKSNEQVWNDFQNKEVYPYFTYSKEQTLKRLQQVEALKIDTLKMAIVSAFRSIYEKGIIASEDVAKGDVIYLQRDKHASKLAMSELYTKEEAKVYLRTTLSEFSLLNIDSLLQAHNAYNLLSVNVFYDAQTTDLIKAETQTDISPTLGYIRSGQLIVSNGEIINNEIAEILDSYRKEYESNTGYIGNPFLLWLGNSIIAILLLLLFLMILKVSCPDVFEDKRYLFMLTVFAIFVIMSFLVYSSKETELCIIPFTLIVLMFQPFFKPKEYIALYFLCLFPLLIYAQDGHIYFLIYSIAGIVQVFIFKYFNKGWRQFIAAAINFAVLALSFSLFKLIGVASGEIEEILVYLFISSLLTIAAYPLVLLFEKIFNLVSENRLIELCNTSSTLIRKLESKAPGTFQHSLQVMNMCDTVARAIKVNPDLVRAGALYHDIGKMDNPLCFVENEFMVSAENVQKYHSDLSPLQSAQDIIKHIIDGEELAHKASLPKIIRDFIVTHHGTTTVKYFYSKYLAEGGSEDNIKEFQYKGKKPETKAQVILMICDSVEAASRTLKQYTPKAYSDLVESIVAGKMEEKQFDQADISIHELELVKEAIKQYLAQVNHERIVYPKDKK